MQSKLNQIGYFNTNSNVGHDTQASFVAQKQILLHTSKFCCRDMSMWFLLHAPGHSAHTPNNYVLGIQTFCRMTLRQENFRMQLWASIIQ